MFIIYSAHSGENMSFKKGTISTFFIAIVMFSVVILSGSFFINDMVTNYNLNETDYSTMSEFSSINTTVEGAYKTGLGASEESDTSGSVLSLKGGFDTLLDMFQSINIMSKMMTSARSEMQDILIPGWFFDFIIVVVTIVFIATILLFARGVKF